MPLLSRPNLLLDTTEYKIKVAKVLMDRYQADYNRCQASLTKEVKLRTNLEQYCDKLQRRIGQLETELVNYQMRDREMQAMYEEAERMQNAMKQNNNIHLERIELLTCELAKIHQVAMEADRIAQLSQQRAEQMCKRLQQSELQLEESRTKQMALQSELASAAQNLRCVESAVEHSSQKLQLVDHEMLMLKLRLEETERRAHLAELNAQQLQMSSVQLEQRMEKQLEERWRQKLHNLELQMLAREH